MSSNKLANMLIFAKSFFQVIKNINNTNLIVLDPKKELSLDSNYYKNYYTSDLTNVTDKIIDYIEKEIDTINGTVMICIYNFGKYMLSLENTKKFTDFMIRIKNKENIKIVIFDDFNKIKTYQYEDWFKNCFTISEGIWIGKGISEQSLFKLSSLNRELNETIDNKMGYVISESTPSQAKLIDFISQE